MGGYASGDRDLSPRGHTSNAAERQDVSRSGLQDTPHQSAAPRPPPSGQSSLPVAEPALGRPLHSMSNREHLGSYSSTHYAGGTAPSRSSRGGGAIGPSRSNGGGRLL